MDDTLHQDDFSPLTLNQIQGLAAAVQDAFGGNFSRAEFTNRLLALLEDVPGFETGDVPATLIESAWGHLLGWSLMSRPLFPLGQVVATRGVAAHLERHRISAFLYLDRHAHGDWGSVPAEDARANHRAVVHGARILSSYDIASKYVWIITEADRHMTTLLFPSEY